MEISSFYWELLPKNTRKVAKKYQKLPFRGAPRPQKFLNGLHFQISYETQHDLRFNKLFDHLDLL